MSRKKKRRRHSGRLFVFGMVFVLVLILSVQIVRLYEKDQALKVQQEELEEELAEEEQRTQELEAQQDYVGTDEYVEDVARARLGMVYEDEILFKEE